VAHEGRPPDDSEVEAELDLSSEEPLWQLCAPSSLPSASELWTALFRCWDLEYSVGSCSSGSSCSFLTRNLQVGRGTEAAAGQGRLLTSESRHSSGSASTTSS